jgi:hypothetical protein
MLTAANAALSILLEAVCVFVINWLPFDYVNMFAALGFGLSVGGLVIIGSSLVHLRNPALARGVAILAALTGLYGAWSCDSTARFAKPVYWRLGQQWNYVGEFYQNGFWDIFGLVRVSGLPLAAVSCIEAGVVAASMWIATSTACWPYCETCSERFNLDFRAGLRPSADNGSVLQRLLDGDLAALAEFEASDSGREPYVCLSYYFCSGCSDMRVLTMDAYEPAYDGRGRPMFTRSILIDNAVLDYRSIRQVEAALEMIDSQQTDTVEWGTHQDGE